MGKERLEDHLNPEQYELWKSLDTPLEIQAFLDGIPYSPENRNRSPLEVLQDRQAHCLDGALFGAAALRRIGYSPLVIDLYPDPGQDDDHVLAIYRLDGAYGAVAKSNYVGLRYREPIYRTLRELVISYFEVYYNIHGKKTLRMFTSPLNLKHFDRMNWESDPAGADAIEARLKTARRTHLLKPAMIARLAPVDERSFTAGMQGSNPDGLYQPKVGAEEV
ncbi:MAG TPA: hypothetical protein VMT46_07985 [Anaerolineaceae bacterium]|nr:hypothetical protein [Anaerolineaceae bacterium]